MPLVNDNLRRIMDERGISAVQLQKLSKVSKSTIYYVRDGERDTTTENVEKLARALRIPVYALLCDTETSKALASPGLDDLIRYFGGCSEESRDLIVRVAQAQFEAQKPTLPETA